MKERTSEYAFTEGKNMFATDTLSRYPVGCTDPEDIELNNEVEIASINVASTCVNDYLSVTLVDIRNASYNDEAFVSLESAKQIFCFQND